MMTFKELAWIGAAGAVGTLARFAIAALVQNYSGAKFPWGTLTVNVVGCFLFGLVFILAEEKNLIPAQVKVIVLTGFMGAFTTFSTFGFETTALIHAGDWGSAILNIVGQNLAGIIAVTMGIFLARQF
jgi:CrcB protein